MINFDKKTKRKGTNSLKFDYLHRYFDVNKDDIQPLWVADMDFEIPSNVQKALEKKLKQNIFGYERPSDDLYKSIINWQKRNDLQLKPKNILFTSGVVPSLDVSIKTFSNIDDEIIIQTPVYPPFYNIVEDNNRKLVLNRLKKVNNRYEMDFKDLKSKITKKTKMLLLCSPQNPTGRIFTKKELTKLDKICVKHNILVVSDEIHSDLVYKKFISYASINKKSLILAAPSKTFNIAGFHSSYAFSLNQKIIDKFANQAHKSHITSVNNLSNDIVTSCYSKKSEIWLDELLKYLEKNIKITRKFFKNKLPTIKVTKAESTYLLWLDFTDTNLKHKDIKNKLLYKSKIVLNDGLTFDKKCKCHFRLNIAVNKFELKVALNKIYKAFK